MHNGAGPFMRSPPTHRQLTGAPTVEDGSTALGWAACATSAVAAAQALVPLVPLVLCEERVDSALQEAREFAREAADLARGIHRSAQEMAPKKAVAGTAGGSGADGGQGGLQLALQLKLTPGPLVTPHHHHHHHHQKGANGRPQSPGRRDGAGGTTGRGRPFSAHPQPAPAVEQPDTYDLDISFAPPPGAAPVGGRGVPSAAAASNVLKRPTVSAMLAPYYTLMDAANEAARAVAAAALKQPSDATTARVLSVAPGADATLAAAAARTNSGQLGRWAATVANMEKAVGLVMSGFMETAAAVLRELEVVEIPFDV